MPAYSFQKQFVTPVETGAKTHTIRGKRKNRPKPGQVFYGYYAMRTKQCRKIVQSTITRVEDISIRLEPEGDLCMCGYPRMAHWNPSSPCYCVSPSWVSCGWAMRIEGEALSKDEMEALARRDGFDDLDSMKKFWPPERLPFEGDIIHWKPV